MIFYFYFFLVDESGIVEFCRCMGVIGMLFLLLFLGVDIEIWFVCGKMFWDVYFDIIGGKMDVECVVLL